MKRLLTLLMLFAAVGCAAEVPGDTDEMAEAIIAPDDVGVAAEALTNTGVNNSAALNSATPDALAIGICIGMQYPGGYFVCSGSATNATCDLAFGSAPLTHWVVGNCTSFSGNYPVPNPPGGTLAASRSCQTPIGTITTGTTGGLANQSLTHMQRFGVFVCKPGIHKLWY